MKRRLLSGAATAVLAGAACGAAMAEEGRDEIIVSARKSEERLQDVPASISVVSKEQMKEQGVAEIRDLQYAIPNFSMNGADTSVQPSITLRGINVDQRSVGIEAGYGVYIDGVIAGRVSALNQDVLDIERVEVLRGPQGTLFGRNTIAGAINIVTSTPGDELRFGVTGEAGNYDMWRGSGYVSGPIAPGLLYGKASVSVTKRDGFVDNVTTGDTPENEDRWSARGGLRFTPAPNFTISLSGDYLNRDRISYLNEILEEAPNGGTPPGFLDAFPGVAPGIRTINANRDRREDQESGGGSATVEWALSEALTLTSVTAYRESESVYGSDYDNRAADFSQFNLSLDEEGFSQEVRLATNRIGNIRFLVGGYYFDGSSSQEQAIVTGADAPLLGFPADFAVSSNEGTVDTTTYAAFANGDWYVTDRLTLNAGVRYTHEKKDLLFSIADLFTPFVVVDYTDELSSDDISPTVSAIYALTPDLNVYGTVSQGFKSGGWNAEFVTNLDIAFDEEKVTNYEIGFKGAWLDGALRANLAAFYLDYRDLQVTQTDPNTNRPFTTNAGQAESLGAELELAAEPFEGLTFDLGVGYAHATYKDYTLGSVQYDGNRLVNSPLWTLNASAMYRTPLPALGADGYLRFDFGYRSMSYDSAANLMTRMTPANQNLNARLGIRRGKAELSVFADNILDREQYRNFFSGDTLIAGVIPATLTTANYTPPRTYGVRISFDY